MTDLSETLKKHGPATIPAVRPRGRPDTYDDGIADEICRRIAGGEPLRQICRREDMPPWQTVYSWMGNHSDFAERIARARKVGFDAIAEEALEIAEDGSNDWIERETKDGQAYAELNHEHVQRSKLRVETRLKLLAKWDPARYGDKLDLTTAGNAIQPSVVVFEAVFPTREGDGNDYGPQHRRAREKVRH